MGKQPVAGQKKSKDSIAKAATQKKGGHKKWTKGKAKQKVDQAVFLDPATYEKVMTGIPKIGKHISLTNVVDKFKVIGSIARILLRRLEQSGALKRNEIHSRQGLYYPLAVAENKAAVETKQNKKQKIVKKK